MFGAMNESSDVRDAWMRFADRLAAGDVDSFDDLVASDAKSIIGTAPGEIVEERAQMRFGFDTEGVTLTPGDPKAYEEGSMGWVVDEPDFGFPDGSVMKPRVTAVVRQEDGAWRIVHAHFSVGVPDEEVVELQARWAGR